ncbi:MAG: MATE family efflux transporter, partial [Paludibacteraceae bacterium]|nr:MATE family efflux transporter [Paludibacteraceae bacterium]
MHTDLKDKQIPKLIWYYSLPAIIGTLANTLYNVIDRIFIGQEIGAYAISGLALTFPIMNILGAFGMLIGQGAATRISILLGKKEEDKANIIVFNALILSFVFYVIISILSLYFLDKILISFGGTENTIPYAKSYLTIIIIGHIFTSLNFCLSNIIRSSGHPRIAMFTLLLGAILNVFFDFIFIIIFKTGIKGAAYATTLSAFISCVWVTHYFFRKNNTLHFGKKYFHISREAFIAIISIGLSPFLLQICSSIVNIIMNNTLLKYGGDLAIGAFGITISYTTIVTMAIIGLSQGIQPILGYNFGARQYDRVKKTLYICIIFATIITTIGWIFGMTIPQQIAMIFTNDSKLIAITSHSIKLYTLLLF